MLLGGSGYNLGWFAEDDEVHISKYLPTLSYGKAKTEKNPALEWSTALEPCERLCSGIQRA